MSTEFDKEIDSLLRDRARRKRAASAGRSALRAETRADGDVLAAMASAMHLDADEQNAYAENALPAMTRNAYAAHLADCDDCRRSVTQLALAAGIPTQLEERETSTQKKALPNVTRRQRVGALFAPRAWRYAVPALALLLISAVALIVLKRSSQREASLAQRNTAQPARPSIAQTETHHTTQNGNVVAAPEGQSAGTSAPNSNAPVTSDEIAAKTAREGEARPEAGGAIMKDTAPLGTSAGAVAPPAADFDAPAPTPVPPEAIIVADDPASKSKVAKSVAEQARLENKQTQNENYQRDDANMASRRNEPKRSGPSRSNNIEQAPQVARGGNTNGPRSSADKKDENVAPTATQTPAPSATERRERQRNADSEDDGRKSSANPIKRESRRSPESASETRTVAGRKFRRQDGAWIDTAYNSAQAVTVVRRNSEQYRALIADEPTLRRIADSLGGEVVVVWKGRTYRFR